MKKSIPKIIHYCWFGGNDKSKLIKKCINSWKEYCPDYKIIEWNENNFDLSNNHYAFEAYNNKKWAFVSDYVRLKVLYDYGGIYLDTDVELIKNLDKIIKCDGFFSTENNVTVSTGLGFGATKHNVIVKKMLDDYENIHFILKNGSYNDEACPSRNTRSIIDIINELGDRNEICVYKNNYFYPKEYFCPIDNSTGKVNITPNTIAIHHYTGSWLNDKELKMKYRKQRITNKFGKSIGELYTLPYRVMKKIRLNGFKDTMKIAFNKLLGRKNGKN